MQCLKKQTNSCNARKGAGYCNACGNSQAVAMSGKMRGAAVLAEAGRQLQRLQSRQANAVLEEKCT